MEHRGPLEIPEIADMVGSFLQRQDLASCVGVSKNWRDVFLPRLWQVNVLGRRSKNETPLHIPVPHLFGHDPDVVFHHRHLIQDLTLVKGFEPFVQHQYLNVHKLTIYHTNSAGFWKDHLSLNLKETFPSLVQLTLTHVNLAPGFWKALEAHSRIRSLHMQQTMFASGDRRAFWKVTEGLDVFEMEYCSISGQRNEIQPDIKLFRMRKLLLIIGLRNDISGIHLIARCPMLQDLEWTEQGSLSMPISQILQDVCWPHLKKLEMNYVLTDEELAYLLQRVWNDQKIFQLKLGMCCMETEASAALGLYYNSLVEVDLTDCAMVPSTTTRDLLCHCPRLEVLGTRRVMAGDIVAGEPWVCQQLRKLTACFWFQESEKNLQQDIFWRLSTLTRLEELTMRILKMDVGNGYALAFRRDCGMEHLESLRELTTFRFLSDVDSIHAELGMYELKWIEEHWKKLKILEGRLNSDHEVDAQLKRALEAHGISVAF